MNKVIKNLLFHKIYPSYYKHCCKRKKVNEKKALFVEIRGIELNLNLKMVSRWMEKNRPDMKRQVLYLGWQNKNALIVLFQSFRLIYHMADAGIVFVTDACNVISAVPKREETRIVQLWHACGAFKKFGYSTDKLIWGADKKELDEYPNYGNLDLVTVSSPEIIWAYKEAMGISENLVLALGISRTDLFFDEHYVRKVRMRWKESHPDQKGKKIVLYAPTYRGDIKNAKSPESFPWKEFSDTFGENAVLLVKNHPVVKNPPEIPEECRNSIFDVTGDMKIEDLICISDICITDYSSVIFEYSLRKKPILFFVPDLADYEYGRGFYYSLEEMTPGALCQTPEELINEIGKNLEEPQIDKIDAFREKFMSSCDGHATERIMEVALKDE